MENLEKRIENLSYKLRRYYEDGWVDSYYDDLAKSIINVLETKFGTDESSIERLTEIDIAYELYKYLSAIDLEEYKKYIEEEYNQASEEIKQTFSPLDLYQTIKKQVEKE